MDPLVLHFQRFVTDLTTVEKRSIIALTEIARDALRTHPHLAPSLVSVLANRILQAPSNLKLPALYLLDSIVKTIGEPYKTYFAASLPEIYANAWAMGAPGLHRPLEKLLNTWGSVFPPHVLDSVRARVAAPAGYAQQPLPGTEYPAAQQPPPYDYYGTSPKPMVPDARLTGNSVSAAAAAAAAAAGGPSSYYGGGGGGGYAAPSTTAPGYSAQPPYAAAPAAAPAATPMPDLFALLSSGALAGVAAAAAANVSKNSTTTTTTAAAGVGKIEPRARFGVAAAAAAKGRPPTTEFSNESIKEHNPAAVERLITVTNLTKSNFLDKLFLRRQKHDTGVRSSRLWYVDLDTWMASTTGAGNALQPSTGVPRNNGTTATAAAAASPEQRFSVVADEEQTHCALSGEKFDQFWDEDHQEWRYRDARRLSDEEAARYGLEEGAIVLASVLGNGGATAAAVGGELEKKEAKSGGDEKKRELEGNAEDDTEKPSPTKRVKVET